ncbi:hypothetical protein [Altererythrobacter sp. GH1-8]|uniref:hypothetical protein n=1 Tax=Altererythrobacter sp. GH1-8 TaxID=3349333 RepID=UPI00374CB7F4
MIKLAKPYLPALFALAAGIVAFALGTPGQAQDAKLAVFNSISMGEWTVRFRDGSPARKVCVRTGQELLQLRHEQTGCRQVVVANDAQEATVQYTCQGHGYGRTTLRRETSSLVQLNSQGFADDRPFQFFAEARRTGNCS